MPDIEKTIWIDAPLAIVRSYFTDETKMPLWSGRAARLDPRPDGVYELDMGEAGIISGRFVTVGDTRIVQEIGPPGGHESSTIEISLSEEAGGTRVTIRHSGIPDPFDAIATRGWDHHLARLSVVATGGTAGPDGLCARPMMSLLDESE